MCYWLRQLHTSSWTSAQVRPSFPMQLGLKLTHQPFSFHWQLILCKILFERSLLSLRCPWNASRNIRRCHRGMAMFRQLFCHSESQHFRIRQSLPPCRSQLSVSSNYLGRAGLQLKTGEISVLTLCLLETMSYLCGRSFRLPFARLRWLLWFGCFWLIQVRLSL